MEGGMGRTTRRTLVARGKRRVLIIAAVGAAILVMSGGSTPVQSSPGDPFGGLDVTIYKKPADTGRVTVPDPNHNDEFEVRFSGWPTRFFDPNSDPNNVLQVVGLMIGNDYQLISASIVLPASGGVSGPAPGFGASVSNATTKAAFEALVPAGAGHTWYGLSIPLSRDKVPAVVDLKLIVKSLRRVTAHDLEIALVAGMVGIATADGTGGNFDLQQTLVFMPWSPGSAAVPALTPGGIAILALLLAGAGLIVMNRRRRAESA